MAKILIIGAGIGGLPTAYELRAALDRSHSITIVNASEDFQFVPSNIWIGAGWRSADQITFPLREHLERRGVGFIAQAATHIDPEQNRVTLANGETMPYDYLVITTGPRLAFEEIPGTGPGGHTQSICTLDHALHAYTNYRSILATPKPIVIGAVQGASCFGPAYEYAFVLDADLRRRKLRYKVPMTFVTSEPYIGHLGLGGVGDSKGLLESEFRSRDIRWITNAKVDRAEPGVIHVTEHNDRAEVVKEHALPHGFAMLLPAFKGVDAVAQVAGLCNPRGFVLVNEHQQNPKYLNIYAAGVAIAIPPVEATPIPTGAPKTGYMIETMVGAIVRNIVDAVAGRAAKATGTWNAICLADMGDTAAAFVALPQIPPRNTNWVKKGKWVRWAKIAFEKYFLFKMKRGSTEPFFERYMLKLLGIERLREKT